MGIFLIGIIIAELIPSSAPETIYIRVLKTDNITPETNAICKADIIKNNELTEINLLNKTDYMPLDCYTKECANESYNQGFYELETGLNNYRGKFEIDIVCITPVGVSYTILNNTHIPCDIENNGKDVVCSNVRD